MNQKIILCLKYQIKKSSRKVVEHGIRKANLGRQTVKDNAD